MPVAAQQLDLIIRARLDELLTELRQGAISTEEFTSKAQQLQTTLQKLGTLSDEIDDLTRQFTKGAINAQEFAARAAPLMQRLATLEQTAARAGASGGRLAEMLARNSHMLGQASFALQDFLTVLTMPGMGFTAALRAASNNVAMLAMTLGGPLVGGLTAVAVTAIPALIQGLSRLISSTRDAAEVMKEFDQRLKDVRAEAQKELRLEQSFERARQSASAARDLVRQLRDELRIVEREHTELQRQLIQAMTSSEIPAEVAQEIDRRLRETTRRREELQQRLRRAEVIEEIARRTEERRRFGERREELARRLAERIRQQAEQVARTTGADIFQVLQGMQEEVQVGRMGEELDVAARQAGIERIADLVAYELRQIVERLRVEEQEARAIGAPTLRQRLREQYEAQQRRLAEQQERERERLEKERERQQREREQRLLAEVNRHLDLYTRALEAGGDVLRDVTDMLRDEFQRAGLDAAEALKRLDDMARREAERRAQQEAIERRLAEQERRAELTRQMQQAAGQAAAIGLTALERGERVRRLALMLRERDPSLTYAAALRIAARLSERIVERQLAEQREQFVEQEAAQLIQQAAGAGIPVSEEVARRFVREAMRGRAVDIAGLRRGEELALMRGIRARWQQRAREQAVLRQHGAAGLRQLAQEAGRLTHEQRQGLAALSQTLAALHRAFNEQIAEWQRLRQQLAQMGAMGRGPRRGNMR